MRSPLTSLTVTLCLAGCGAAPSMSHRFQNQALLPVEVHVVESFDGDLRRHVEFMIAPGTEERVESLPRVELESVSWVVLANGQVLSAGGSPFREGEHTVTIRSAELEGEPRWEAITKLRSGLTRAQVRTLVPELRDSGSGGIWLYQGPRAHLRAVFDDAGQLSSYELSWANYRYDEDDDVVREPDPVGAE